MNLGGTFLPLAEAGVELTAKDQSGGRYGKDCMDYR